MARVSEQRFSMTERADNDIALVDGGHSAARQFKLVVTCLVIQDAHGNEHAFLTGNIGRQPEFVAQVTVLGNGGDFIHENAAHYSGLSGGCAGPGLQQARQRQNTCVTERIPGRPLAGGFPIHAFGGGKQRVW